MPDVLEMTAKTWDDEIMGVRHREALAGTATPLEGVQFHPESIMTTAGKAMLLANFLAASPGATGAMRVTSATGQRRRGARSCAARWPTWWRAAR
jgi:hypothetical protein